MSVSELAADPGEALRHFPAISDSGRTPDAWSPPASSPPRTDSAREIVAEGDPADKFYLLAAGTARVVKRTDGGDEVALAVLRGGDAFGEMALLSDSVREATVRASGPVDVLRLDRTIFQAITRSCPEVGTAFAALARQRTLANFLRLDSAFSELPKEALIELASQLEQVEVTAGTVVIDEGETGGADVRDRGGTRPRLSNGSGRGRK